MNEGSGNVAPGFRCVAQVDNRRACDERGQCKRAVASRAGLSRAPPPVASAPFVFYLSRFSSTVSITAFQSIVFFWRVLLLRGAFWRFWFLFWYLTGKECRSALAGETGPGVCDRDEIFLSVGRSPLRWAAFFVL